MFAEERQEKILEMQHCFADSTDMGSQWNNNTN